MHLLSFSLSRKQTLCQLDPETKGRVLAQAGVLSAVDGKVVAFKRVPLGVVGVPDVVLSIPMHPTRHVRFERAV
jgi:hypothetical protein